MLAASCRAAGPAGEHTGLRDPGARARVSAAGYDQELGRLSQLLKTNDITFVSGLNEEAAATSMQGSQLACTLPEAAPDALRHVNLMGAHHRDHFTQNIGDGMFDHSGSLAIRAPRSPRA